MNLPFTREQFFDAFAFYHRLFWPLAVLLWGATLGIAVARFRGRASDRLVTALLAFHWLWAGLAYHAVVFRPINPAATIFAAAFVLQAVLLVRAGLMRSDLRFGRPAPGWRALSVVFTAAALLYPVASMLASGDPLRSPTFGVPCPTALLTAGLLFGAVPRAPRHLLVIPALWSLLAGDAALTLGVMPDLLLLAAAALLGAEALWPLPSRAAARAG